MFFSCSPFVSSEILKKYHFIFHIGISKSFFLSSSASSIATSLNEIAIFSRASCTFLHLPLHLFAFPSVFITVIPRVASSFRLVNLSKTIFSTWDLRSGTTVRSVSLLHVYYLNYCDHRYNRHLHLRVCPQATSSLLEKGKRLLKYLRTNWLSRKKSMSHIPFRIFFALDYSRTAINHMTMLSKIVSWAFRVFYSERRSGLS